VTYWIHRSFHSKFLFKHFHSIHHRYFQPTPWSVTAIHPLELITVQLAMVLPIFIYPVHWCEYTPDKYACCSTYIFFLLLRSYFDHIFSCRPWSYKTTRPSRIKLISIFLHSSVLWIGSLHVLSRHRTTFGNHFQGAVVAALATGLHVPRQPPSVLSRQLWI